MTKKFPVPKHLRTQPYWKDLNNVIDPELNIGIVDLGLIYDVKIKNNTATVIMTLTTPSCPVGPLIIQQIEDRMLFYKGIKKVYIEVVWDPIWTQEMIDPDIRDLMFGI